MFQKTMINIVNGLLNYTTFNECLPNMTMLTERDGFFPPPSVYNVYVDRWIKYKQFLIGVYRQSAISDWWDNIVVFVSIEDRYHEIYGPTNFIRDRKEYVFGWRTPGPWKKDFINELKDLRSLVRSYRKKQIERGKQINKLAKKMKMDILGVEFMSLDTSEQIQELIRLQKMYVREKGGEMSEDDMKEAYKDMDKKFNQINDTLLKMKE